MDGAQSSAMNKPQPPVEVPVSEGDAHQRRPAAMCRGQGHLVVYGNPAFLTAFGPQAVGMPARESLVSLPPSAFTLLDLVLARGKPLARWIRFDGADWRMTVAPRVDASGEIYGVSLHLRARSDVPSVPAEQD
jgi:hypothetical protein